MSRSRDLKRLRRWQASRKPVKHALPAVKQGIMVESSTQQMDRPVTPEPDHIPTTLRLERRPTRDAREEELLQLRTEDGRVMAVVERVDVGLLLN